MEGDKEKEKDPHLCADCKQYWERLARTVDSHSLLLGGNPSVFPPVDGIVQVLKKISETIAHPESGNLALDKRLADLRSQNAQRSSFLNGAKWLTVLLFTVGGTLLGLAIAFGTMMRTH